MLPGHPSHEPTLRLHELPLSDRSKRWDPITYGDRELQGVQSSFQGVLAARCYVTPRASRACFNDGASVQLELSGFTGKEADEEVGVVYFGERYLIPRIGRWASPDPLAIHAAGGGEALNAYHYVSGNLLQARDPIGLEGEDRTSDSGGIAAPIEVNTAPEGIRYGQEFVLIPGEVPEGAERIAKHTYLAPQSTLESLKERGANSYVYNPDAKLSLETARRVEAEHGPSRLRDLAHLIATMQGLVTDSAESLPGVRGIRGGESPHGSDTDGAYLAVIAAQMATAVGPPSIARLARVAAKAARTFVEAAKKRAFASTGGAADSITQSASRLGNDVVHASTPVGRRGTPMTVSRGTNAPATIEGRHFTGHALDQMQSRGFTPTVVENAIRNGAVAPGRVPETFQYTYEGVRAITNISGGVITVIPR